MPLCPWDFPGKNTGVGCHSFSRDIPDPRIEPGSPALQANALPSEPAGKPVPRVGSHWLADWFHRLQEGG